MAYTVKKLSKISGVSVRTLHFYDELGLLKPARYGENGYRYYEREQLLMLQQILFYRELGFPLGEIQQIIGSGTFDKLKALKTHKATLEANRLKFEKLIRTVDRTIAHLQGDKQMSDETMYEGFDKEKQAGYEKELTYRYGECGNRFIEQSRKNTRDWKKADWDGFRKEADEIHQLFASAVSQSLSPTDPNVQALVRRHYQMIARFYEPTPTLYAGLGDLYQEHPDFRKVYDAYHPKLAEFLSQAMKAFSKHQLSKG